LSGLCAAPHEVAPLNHSRDLDALWRNFFVSFCLGSKAAKAKGLSWAKRAFRDAGRKPLRSSGGNLDISRDCLFSLDRQRLYFAQLLSNHLVPRRRKAASKDALVRSDLTESWAMLRDAALPRSSSHEIRGRSRSEAATLAVISRARCEGFIKPKKPSPAARAPGRYLFRRRRTSGLDMMQQP
jgi:hypothetical protein